MVRLPSLLLAMMVSAHLSAETLVPYLVRDLTPGMTLELQQIYAGWSYSIGDVLFFYVEGQGGGVWRTDGTVAGTFRIYDGIAEKHDDILPWPPAAWNGSLYYGVGTRGGRYLVKTDGTTAGTVVLGNFGAWYGGAPCGDGKFCFAVEGSKIGVTDGTPAGTMILKSTAEGVETYESRGMTAFGKRVFFNAYDRMYGLCANPGAQSWPIGSSEVCGEVWTSDGTIAGTHLFKDLFPGTGPSAARNFYAASDGKLYFMAACSNSETYWAFLCPYISDGTPEGTRVLVDRRSSWRDPPSFFEVGGKLYFSQWFGNLYQTNGTTGGTIRVEEQLRLPTTTGIAPAGEVNGSMLLFVRDSKLSLWTYDGTTGMKIADVPDRTTFLGTLSSSGRGYFFTGGADYQPADLWSTDGTSAGTRKERSLPLGKGSFIYKWVTTSTHFYYTDNAHQLFAANESEARQIELNVPVGRSTTFYNMKVIGDHIFFNDFRSQLFVSDGTEGGTQIVAEDGSNPFEFEGSIWFRDSRQRIYKTDGTKAGTVRVEPQSLGVKNFSLVGPPVSIGNKTVVGVADPGNNHLLAHESTSGASEKLPPIGNFSDMRGVPGGLLVWRENRPSGSPELWFSDGTIAGSRALTAGVYARGPITPIRNCALFAASKDASQPLSLWVTDFTVNGTKVIKELAPNSQNLLNHLAVWKGLQFFSVGTYWDNTIWRSDGTSEGTFPITDHTRFDAAFAEDDGVTFIHYPPNGGYEAWTSDGSLAGTKKISADPTCVRSANPFLVSSGGVAVTCASSWVQLQPVYVRNTRTNDLKMIDGRGLIRTMSLGTRDRLFFVGGRASTGSELWAVPLDGSTPPATAVVSIDYAGMTSIGTGTAALFRVHLRSPGIANPRVTATTVDGTLESTRDYVPFTRDVVFQNDNDVVLVVPLRNPNVTGTFSVVLSAPSDTAIERGFATALIGLPPRRRSVRQ